MKGKWLNKKFLAGSLAMFVASQAYSAEQVTNMARDAGYQSCLSTVADLDNFFGDGQNYGAWSLWASDKPNEQIFNAALEITFKDGSQVVDFTVAPTKDGNCSYTYTRSWYSEKNCLATSRESFMKDATYKTELNKNVMAFETNSANLLLMPAGSGCFVQKKEIGFRHKKQS